MIYIGLILLGCVIGGAIGYLIAMLKCTYPEI